MVCFGLMQRFDYCLQGNPCLASPASSVDNKFLIHRTEKWLMGKGTLVTHRQKTTSGAAVSSPTFYPQKLPSCMQVPAKLFICTTNTSYSSCHLGTKSYTKGCVSPRGSAAMRQVQTLVLTSYQGWQKANLEFRIFFAESAISLSALAKGMALNLIF